MISCVTWAFFALLPQEQVTMTDSQVIVHVETYDVVYDYKVDYNGEPVWCQQ